MSLNFVDLSSCLDHHAEAVDSTSAEGWESWTKQPRRSLRASLREFLGDLEEIEVEAARRAVSV